MQYVLITIFLFGVDVLLVEILHKLKVNDFYTRKIGHIIGALISIWMFTVLSLYQFIFVCCLLILVNLLSKFFTLFKSIEKTDPTSLGTILFPLTVLAVGASMWNYPSIYFASILILGLADSSAALIGKTFGKHKVSKNSKKTWEGFFAFVFITSVISLYFSYDYLHTLNFLQIIFIFLMSVFLSFIELFSIKGSDNLFVTLFATLFLYLILI